MEYRVVSDSYFKGPKHAYGKTMKDLLFDCCAKGLIEPNQFDNDRTKSLIQGIGLAGKGHFNDKLIFRLIQDRAWGHIEKMIDGEYEEILEYE